jgi:trk system potassium uptake protein TrkA
MKVIVVGCGRMGADLAYRLYKRGHDVAVIDHLESSFNLLSADFQGRFYEGDALNNDVLHRAGIETCDALAAVTNVDALNLVLGHAAQTHFKVPFVVARNYDPRSLPLYENFGIQVISAISWAAQRLEEIIYHSEVRTVFSAGNGEVEVYELKIPPAWNGIPVNKLNQCEDCLTIALTRAGKAMIPAPTTVMQKDDIVHFSATLDGIEAMRYRISHRPEEV